MTIEEMRKRKRILGFTNETLADRSGVPLGTVQKVMAGVTRSPRKKTMDALAAVLEEERESYPHIHPTDPGMFVRETYPAYKVGEREYTIADIEALPDGILAELIDGKICYMACPTTTHQEIIAELYLTIANYIRANQGTCKAYLSPFAVYLREDKDYLVPDLTVICDKDKIDDKGCHGAPDWVIEVVSPSSRKRDTVVKLMEYRQEGVREYWIIYPDKRIVIVYLFESGSEDTCIYSFDESIPSYVYPDLLICLADNF